MAHKIATKEDALDDDDDDDDARLSLPIRRYQKEIVRAVRENAVVVILGETGSGKTTQIAQMLYENMEEEKMQAFVTPAMVNIHEKGASEK